MEIQCRFNGCSCGCTPSDSATFEGGEPDIYAAIASWAREYMTRDRAPFRKLSIPEKAQDILLAWRDLCDEEKILESEKLPLVKKAKGYEEAAKTLGIEIPEEKLREINADRILITEIEGKLSALSARRTALLAYENASWNEGD